MDGSLRGMWKKAAVYLTSPWKKISWGCGSGICAWRNSKARRDSAGLLLQLGLNDDRPQPRYFAIGEHGAALQSRRYPDRNVLCVAPVVAGLDSPKRTFGDKPSSTYTST